VKDRLLQEIAALGKEADVELREASNVAAAEACRVKYLGRKGRITSILKTLSELPPEDRPAVGREINAIKARFERECDALRQELSRSLVTEAVAMQRLDVTLPGRRIGRGRPHPLRLASGEILRIFTDMGFSVHLGPEIETDYYNFEALGVPADHPARDMQDTFYVEGGYLLRTHTSPVQIHVMENQRPPIRAVFPGAVYRRDNDVSHSPMFHQVEGLMVDRDVTMGDLKGVLSAFCHRMFGGKLLVRFRPSYFPFTEPSAEVDIQCVICGGRGCRVCKHSGWLEILGCGMVDPVVFESVGFDARQVSGFAFGMGVERIAMLTYAIGDIRTFYENDVRFVEQF
jgi:phenylalanyl-tRNA synthetase alpha chain